MPNPLTEAAVHRAYLATILLPRWIALVRVDVTPRRRGNPENPLRHAR